MLCIVFFFFKQKTAYEMRISDWSSDVCSSDLIKLMLPQDDDPHDKIPASTHLLGAIRTVIIADAVMSLDNVVSIAGAADGHIGLVADGILISVPILVWGSKLVRSDEHTSELQSLMRISYSFFCIIQTMTA